MRSAGSCAIGILAAGVALGQAFAPTGALKFEVATFKLSGSDQQIPYLQPVSNGARYSGANLPLRLYLSAAFQVKREQISGGPGWLDSDPYDMNAQAAKPSGLDELHAMLQSLLMERLKLRFHRETKEMAAYVLTVDKGGERNLKASDPAKGNGIEPSSEGLIHLKWKMHGLTMADLAWQLSQRLDRPVVDQTGLKGGYDFELSYTADLPPGMKEGQMFNGTPLDAYGPTIFAALPQQLGLRLESRKAPVEVMVIDHAERPDQD